MSAPPFVRRGKILAYRIYDAGDTIAIDVAEKKLGFKRVEMGGPLAEGLVIAARPVEIDLGECSVAIKGESLQAHVSAHVYDFGVVSVLYEIAVAEGATFESLTPLCDALYDARELDTRGRDLRAELVKKLGDAVEKPHDWAEAETYTILFIEDLGGVGITELAKSEAVAKLLLGETSKKSLSQAVRDDVLKNSFSYLEDDIVIVDWNSAVVVEPSGTRIVPHVLELATSQLLEFRFYDGLLDKELGRVYDHVEKARPRILRSPYGALTKEVLRRYMELTEFTERADNAIKAVGDFYLSRVYLSAIRRFRVPEWRESVETKLRLVAHAYELLKGDVDVSRTTLLEIVVVLLILVEVVAALRGHG